jgi:DNA polymerase-3 subunit gamma/tau
VLEAVRAAKLNAWVVLQTAEARNLVDDVLTVTFVSENDVANFKQPHPSGDSVSEYLRKAIVEVLGLRVKFVAKVEARPEAEQPVVEPAAVVEPVETPAAEPVSTSSTSESGWAVAAIPESEPTTPAPRKRAEPAAKAEPTDKRYGESVVREMLGASFLEEQPLTPRVVPTARDE